MDNKNNETKEYILTEEELKAVSGGKSSQVPGINCPRCGKFIPTTITDYWSNLVSDARTVCWY